MVTENLFNLSTILVFHPVSRALKDMLLACHSSIVTSNSKFVMQALGFPGGSDGKESARNAGDPGSIPGSGKSPGEGNGNPLQYSCLGNPMDRGTWWATVHGVTKSQTQLSDFTFTFINP